MTTQPIKPTTQPPLRPERDTGMGQHGHEQGKQQGKFQPQQGHEQQTGKR